MRIHLQSRTTQGCCFLAALVLGGSMSACGRIGFEAAELAGGEGVDSGPADAPPMVDAMVSLVDADSTDAMPIDAAPPPIDAANTCNVAVPACPSESFSLVAGAATELSAELFNQPDVVTPPPEDLCAFPASTADYSYQIDLQDSGEVTIGSPSRTGWYLLDGACGGNMVMCSPVGATEAVSLSAGTYTLVVEEVDSTSGMCKTFDVAVLGPPLS